MKRRIDFCHRPKVDGSIFFKIVDDLMTAFALSTLMLIVAICVSCITAWMLGEL